MAKQRVSKMKVGGRKKSRPVRVRGEELEIVKKQMAAKAGHKVVLGKGYDRKERKNS